MCELVDVLVLALWCRVQGSAWKAAGQTMLPGLSAISAERHVSKCTNMCLVRASHTLLGAKGLVESVAFEQENKRLEKKNKVNQSHHRALTKDHKQ